MFQSGIYRERKGERNSYYLPTELIQLINRLAVKKQTTRSKVLVYLIKKGLGDYIEK